MRTLVISDLHLGARTRAGVLERPAALETLVAALDGVDRLVLLGDVVELRQGPAAEALATARPVLAALGAAMAGGEVVLVPGNHDHGLIRPWSERSAPGLEQRLAPADAPPLAAAVAGALGGRVEVAYPGLWLRDDVYATHGHYLDVHGSVPSFERIGAGLMARMGEPPPRRGATPADYEAILGPIYAWIESAAAHARPGRRAAGHGRSGEVWGALANTGRRTVRARALLAGFPVGIATLNRIGVGPLSRDLSGPALRRGLLLGMREAVERLGIGAAHVVFGHTHRAGPLPGDAPGEWYTGATQLHNTGSWVFEPAFVGDRGAAAPHWPGGAVELGAGGPPVLRRLLAGATAEELRPPRSPG